MGKVKDAMKRKWRGFRSSSRFHGVLVFLVFVAIAAIFWFIMALNDNVTETFKVKFHIENVPDSVTFITVPPTELHVTVRDKGTNFIRSGLLRDPVLSVNFRDFSEDGVFLLTRSDVTAAIKTSFGNSVQIQSASLDSLRLNYTTGRGKRVPVVVRLDVTAASGYIISGRPETDESGVRIYARGHGADTISHVMTEMIVRRNLSQNTVITAKLAPIPNVRIIPSTIQVKIPVEPLVRKEIYAEIEAVNVPAGTSLLLFPNRVPVSCYVPMSTFNDTEIPITVKVDFLDTKASHGNKMPVHVGNFPDYVYNLEINQDSVEYTLVKK